MSYVSDSRNVSGALVELSLSIGVEEIVAAGKKAKFLSLFLLIKFEDIYTRDKEKILTRVQDVKDETGGS